jgi:hypothetical protein
MHGGFICCLGVRATTRCIEPRQGASKPWPAAYTMSGRANGSGDGHGNGNERTCPRICRNLDDPANLQKGLHLGSFRFIQLHALE